ncbi:AbrB/MazE/SpoVT family DNA-binding domain-containing protein [Idiomarina piscisalsi]|uniref:Addiction module antitoxin n=1 Tax=Idiomarina piscisalsi TaxID=1096243 RepID=A0A432YMW8_9GAMM|nr:AbrB/MazE/SpoVT family DNA-binding domain-containing protein [Idiomarina piscisalsi]RUO62286.1 addiction module antitoxin [Idiomarina piscisalsi]
MEIQIRKIGNSKGAVIPAPLLKELGLDIGTSVDAHTENGRLVLEPKRAPKYQLDELLQQCDPQAAVPDDLTNWEQANAVGNELL